MSGRVQISDATRAVIVELYARTGRWCDTARLIFIGPAKDAPVTKCSASPPGKYPGDLVAECVRARRDFEAGRWVSKLHFADVDEVA